MTTTVRERQSVSPFIAAELRAVIARQGTTGKDVAHLMGRPQSWISRRIGRTADVVLTFDDVVQMAQALGVDAEGLVVAALRACRDSNPKPSVLSSGVITLVTADRRARSAWGLAA